MSAAIFVWRKACQWCGRPQSVVTTASLAVLRRKMQDAAKACQWYGLPRATSPTVSFTCLRCVFGPMELPSKACQWYGSCRRAMRSLLRDTEPSKREPCAVGFGKKIWVKIKLHFWVSPRSPKCNFWEPLQAKMDWKEKIRDLSTSLNNFGSLEKHTKGGGGLRPPPPL